MINSESGGVITSDEHAWDHWNIHLVSTEKSYMYTSLGGWGIISDSLMPDYRVPRHGPIICLKEWHRTV